MPENKSFFRMNTLLSLTDIDAFTAQKELGSRIPYFEALDRFIHSAPESAKALEQMSENGAHPDFLQVIDELQDGLMTIGASSMVWEAEKVAALAREGEDKKCIDEAFLLASKLRKLQEKIREAKVEEPDKAKVKPAQSAPAMDVDQSSRQQAPARSEPIEKLILLIENFELDDALSALRSLLGYSFTKDVDTILMKAYRSLATYDYETALLSLRRALQMVQAMESDARKSSKKRILAIDDMPDVLNTVKAVLSARYQVFGVTNHKTALKFLASNHADLILLDIEMPDMDGFSMLSIIRRIKAYLNTPVLFLTGNVSVENVRKSFDLGANDFIKKPIEAQVLIGKIERHIYAGNR